MNNNPEQVRVIGIDGVRAGVFNTLTAQSIAHEAGLDLIIVNDTVYPPIAKMVDRGRLKYEEDKKRRKARRNATPSAKEIRFGLGIDDNDIRTKVRKIESFLNDGITVQVTVVMKGREQSRPELAYELMKKIVSMIDGVTATPAKRNGRNVIIMLTPRQRKR